MVGVSTRVVVFLLLSVVVVACYYVVVVLLQLAHVLSVSSRVVNSGCSVKQLILRK